MFQGTINTNIQLNLSYHETMGFQTSIFALHSNICQRPGKEIEVYIYTVYEF